MTARKQKRERLSDVIRERNAWKLLAHVQLLAIAVVAKDPEYECRCGTGGYTDGMPCPVCFATMALHDLKETRKAMGLKLPKKRKEKARKE